MAQQPTNEELLEQIRQQLTVTNTVRDAQRVEDAFLALRQAVIPPEIGNRLLSADVLPGYTIYNILARIATFVIEARAQRIGDADLRQVLQRALQEVSQT
jgi:hypothetical protein